MKLLSTLLLTLAITLCSCTKTELTDNVVNDYSRLEVTQVKGVTTIRFITEPKDYARIVDVICVYGSQELGTVLYVYPGVTESVSTHSVNAMLTGYYLKTFKQYHQ